MTEEHLDRLIPLATLAVVAAFVLLLLWRTARAQAQAEVRRAAAVAREQEMKALVEENRAKVVEAEAEIPLAMSQAFRDGHLGVAEYYNLRNVQADTSMRNAIAQAGKNSDTKDANGK